MRLALISPCPFHVYLSPSTGSSWRVGSCPAHLHRLRTLTPCTWHRVSVLYCPHQVKSSMILRFLSVERHFIACISYLLLCNKLSQNSAAANLHLLPHGFCGSGIQAQWVGSPGSGPVMPKVSAGAAVTRRLKRRWIRLQLLHVTDHGFSSALLN